MRAKKPDGCEYDDGKGKTRTQIMRETIARLERRIRELEDPEYVSPGVTLYDPHSHSRSGSSASSTGSPDSSFLSVSHSPFASGSIVPSFAVLALTFVQAPLHHRLSLGFRYAVLVLIWLWFRFGARMSPLHHLLPSCLRQFTMRSHNHHIYPYQWSLVPSCRCFLTWSIGGNQLISS